MQIFEFNVFFRCHVFGGNSCVWIFWALELLFPVVTKSFFRVIVVSLFIGFLEACFVCKLFPLDLFLNFWWCL